MFEPSEKVLAMSQAEGLHPTMLVTDLAIPNLQKREKINCCGLKVTQSMGFCYSSPNSRNQLSALPFIFNFMREINFYKKKSKSFLGESEYMLIHFLGIERKKLQQLHLLSSKVFPLLLHKTQGERFQETPAA